MKLKKVLQLSNLGFSHVVESVDISEPSSCRKRSYARSGQLNEITIFRTTPITSVSDLVSEPESFFFNIGQLHNW